MLIGLLVFLGVDLAVVIVLIVAVLVRRRWLKRRSSATPSGAIGDEGGDLDGLGSSSD